MTNVGPNHITHGIIEFGDRPYTILELGDAETMAEVIKALLRAHYNGDRHHYADEALIAAMDMFRRRYALV